MQVARTYHPAGRPGAALILGGVFALTALVSAACAPRGDVRAVQSPEAPGAIVAIGFIENRDTRFSPFASKNFIDMLEFELMQLNYEIAEADLSGLADARDPRRETRARAADEEDVDAMIDRMRKEPRDSEYLIDEVDPDVEGRTGNTPEADRPRRDDGATQTEGDAEAADEAANGESDEAEAAPAEDANEADAGTSDETNEEAAENRRTTEGESPRRPLPIRDDTRDMLPEELKYIAGEQAPRELRTGPEERLLKQREIEAIGAKGEFDYYVQGAIGRMETGYLLELEENTLIFLEIYNKEGRKVGAINFTVDNRTLQQADFLRDVAERIARNFRAAAP